MTGIDFFLSPATGTSPLPTDPWGYGVLGVVLALILTGWLKTKSDYDTQVRRADKLEAANDKLMETNRELTEALRERREVDEVLKKVLDALPVGGSDRPPRRMGSDRR